MDSFKWVFPLVGMFLLTFLSACARKDAPSVTNIRTLEIEETLDVMLPPGGQILQETEEAILFMGARVQQTPTRRLTLFDKSKRETRWQVLLEGTPTRALVLPEGDIVVVTNDNAKPPRLIRLNGKTGESLWEQVFEQPALDALLVDTLGLVVSDGVTVWRVDPNTGERMTTLARGIGEHAQPEAVYLETTPDDSRLYVASGRLLVAFDSTTEQLQELWRFKSAKFIAEVKAVRFRAGEDGVVVLSHSHVYFVDARGKRRWHIENSDINYGAVAFPSPRDAEGIAFANYVKGIYLVAPDGTFNNTPLPGGKVRVLGIPLPIPKNVLLGGISIQPKRDKGQEQTYWLSVRSLDSIFLYTLTPPTTLSLAAQATIAEGDGTLIEKANTNPNYPPFWLDYSLALTTPKGIVVFRVEPLG